MAYNASTQQPRPKGQTLFLNVPTQKSTVDWPTWAQALAEGIGREFVLFQDDLPLLLEGTIVSVSVIDRPKRRQFNAELVKVEPCPPPQGLERQRYDIYLQSAQLTQYSADKVRLRRTGVAFA